MAGTPPGKQHSWRNEPADGTRVVKSSWGQPCEGAVFQTELRGGQRRRRASRRAPLVSVTAEATAVRLLRLELSTDSRKRAVCLGMLPADSWNGSGAERKHPTCQGPSLSPAEVAPGKAARRVRSAGASGSAPSGGGAQAGTGKPGAGSAPRV